MTARYYGELAQYFKSVESQDRVTEREIDEFAVAYWGEAVRELDTKREGALEAIGSLIPNTELKSAAETKINQYFDERRAVFENHFEAAVDAFRQDYTRDHPATPNNDPKERLSGSVDRYAFKPFHSEPRVEFLRDDERRAEARVNPEMIVANVTRPNEFQNGRVIEHTPPITPAQTAGQPPPLEPKPGFRPPLDFIQRHGGQDAAVPRQHESWEELCARKMQESQAQPPEHEQEKVRELGRSLER